MPVLISRYSLPEEEAPAVAADVGPDYRRAIVLACILCGLLTAVCAIVPPSMFADPGWGMLEWRTLTDGGPANSIVSPDPVDLAKDRTVLVTWWSPGQYLVPGLFTRFGLRMGSAFAVTAGLSLLCSLLGWIRLAGYFAMSPRAAILLVVFMSTFRYATLPFSIYNGGEMLLQGITPWLILAGCRVPLSSALRAALLAALVVLIGFFAKLTGVLVAGAALVAGALAALIRLRRITSGMVAGAGGAILALGLLYVAWFSRGNTPASGTGWSFCPGPIAFALAAPWGAGVSWMDMLVWLLLNPGRALLKVPTQIVWFLLPAVFFFPAVILWGWRRFAARRSELRVLIIVTGCFYAVCALSVALLYVDGSAVSIEERHLRSAGALIFVCAWRWPTCPENLGAARR